MRSQKKNPNNNTSADGDRDFEFLAAAQSDSDDMFSDGDSICEGNAYDTFYGHGSSTYSHFNGTI